VRPDKDGDAALKRIQREVTTGGCRHPARVYLRAMYRVPPPFECVQEFDMRLPDLGHAGAVDYGRGAALATWGGNVGPVVLLIRDRDGLFKFAFYQAKAPIPRELSGASDRVAKNAVRAVGDGAAGCRVLDTASVYINGHPDRPCRDPLVLRTRAVLKRDRPARLRRLGSQAGFGMYSLRLTSGRSYTVVLVRGSSGYLYLGSFPSPS
jgi:hypothetical protein